MRKLKLELEGLSVESFHADAVAREKTGAVAQATTYTQQARCTTFCTYDCTGTPCYDFG